MNLYKKNNWNDFHKTETEKFFMQPIRKINYLVKPTDIIQTNQSTLLYAFKTNPSLLKKPIPKNFIQYSAATNTQKTFQYKSNKITALNSGNNTSNILATVIDLPSYRSLLWSDRNNQQVFRWITL